MNQHSLLESGPIPSLILRMAFPIILAGLVNSLYHVVDAYFITHYIGSYAMAGVAIVMPLFLFIAAITMMISTGGASYLSRLLGAKAFDECQEMAGAIVMTGLIISSVLTVVVYWNLELLLNLLGVSEQVFPYALAFSVPFLLATPVMQMFNIVAELYRVEGKMTWLSGFMVTVTCLNILFDALFIIVFEMGVKGAAYATILSIFIVLCISATLLMRGDHTIKLLWSNFKTSLSNSLQILSLGLPTFTASVATMIVLALINTTVLEYGGADADLIVAAYGIVFRVFTFACAPLIGLAVALQTIVGFNAGAGEFARVKQCLVYACGYGSVVACIVALPLVFIPDIIYQSFTDDTQMVSYASQISMLVFIGFTTKGVAFLAAPYFQALGDSGKSFILSLCQGFLLLIPLVFLFAKLYGANGVIMAIPVADGLFFALALSFFFVQWQKLKSTHTAPSNAG